MLSSLTIFITSLSVSSSFNSVMCPEIFSFSISFQLFLIKNFLIFSCFSFSYHSRYFMTQLLDTSKTRDGDISRYNLFFFSLINKTNPWIVEALQGKFFKQQLKKKQFSCTNGDTLTTTKTAIKVNLHADITCQIFVKL